MDKPDLLRLVAERANLREGPKGVENALRAISQAGQESGSPLDERTLARIIRMPVPVVMAVCRELAREGLIEAGPPLRLTAEGDALITPDARGRVKSVRVGGGDQKVDRPASVGAQHATPLRCPTCAGTGISLEQAKWQGVIPALRRYMGSEGAAERLLCRLASIHEQGGLAGKDLLVMGDDLSPAVAVALLGKALSPSGRLARRVVALHYDERRLRHLRDIAQREGVIIGLVTYNLQRALPDDLQGEFSTVWASPPAADTLPLYLSRAVEAAMLDGGGRILLLSGDNSPADRLDTQRTITEMGLLIEHLFTEQGGSQTFYSLRVTEETMPLVEGDYTGAL